MSLSCLYHRWFAGRDSDGVDGGIPSSLKRHAESCPRCAIYTQRLRSLDSRFRSVRGGCDDDFPESLHAKIMAAVREERWVPARAAVAQSAESPRENHRSMFFAFCGAAAAIVLVFVALSRPGVGGNPIENNPEIAKASVPGDNAPAIPETDILPEPTTPDPVDKIASSPVEPLSKSLASNDLVPATTRRVAKFTGDLPSLLVSKVSKPYESEMESIADDLNAATDFLSNCLFVAEVRQSTGL